MKFRIKETGKIVEKIEGNFHRLEDGTDIYKTLMDRLGLTLEEIKPEPKKLYAYSKYIDVGVSSNEIIFRTEDVGGSHRQKQYDIVYGDET